jgi:endonuclease/exonuclease/phosphatase (EEP) superfamily protein YafD
MPRLGTVACLAGIIAGLSALAAGRLAGLWIELDVFNHFIPHIALLIGACLLGLLVRRGRIATVLGIMLIGVIGIGLWPHWASRQDAAPAVAGNERIVRVMTFNTRFESADWRAVADEVLRQDPDIVVLLEVGRSKLPLFEALETVYPHRADCLAEDYCQNVILSKTGFVSSETRSEWRGPALVQVEYGPDLGGLTMVGIHTTRPPFAAKQFEQMKVLGNDLAKGSGARIVAGDFNASPWSLMLRTLLERSGLRLASGLATWPATVGLPQIAIDHILVSSGLRVLGRTRIGMAGQSDHYPVIAEIAVPLND